MRLLVLPSDPAGHAVPFDTETLAWLKEDRDPPYGGSRTQWGSYDRATPNALVRYQHYGTATRWSRYLALHRHGGLDVGVGRLAYPVREMTVVPLRRIVGIIWNATELQHEASARWELAGPYEISVGIRIGDSSGAVLGDFAEGWMGPEDWTYEPTTCGDEHVLLRREVDTISPEEFSIELGNRLEHAFGTVCRRHIANRGDYQGRFDPRFQI